MSYLLYEEQKCLNITFKCLYTFICLYYIYNVILSNNLLNIDIIFFFS